MDGLRECEGCRREQPEQLACHRCSGTGNEPTWRRIKLWACPNPDCGSYYGSSTAGDLRHRKPQRSEGKPNADLSDCPYCPEQRELIKLNVPVPVRE